jgi:hypothetical protein
LKFDDPADACRCVCQVTLSLHVHLRFASRIVVAKDFSPNDRDLVELQPHAGVVMAPSQAGRRCRSFNSGGI